MLYKKTKLHEINRTLKKAVFKKFWLAFSTIWTIRRKLKFLLKVIERVYTKNPEMQKLIEELMINVRKEEGVLPEQVFLCFSLLLA